MIRRNYRDAGYFHGIVESYDTLDDGTHAYLVSFPSDGDLVHVAVDEVRRSMLSRFDRLCYEERRLHADPVASWTGLSPPPPVDEPTVHIKRAHDIDSEDTAQSKAKRPRGKRGLGATTTHQHKYRPHR
jgi:hypothetical protein